MERGYDLDHPGLKVHVNNHHAMVELWYPRLNPPRVIHVGLVDVRAADDIRIHYDFNRDGWVIQQASRFEWAADDDVMDPDWQEVAFVQAWARERVKMGEPPA